MGHGKVVEIGDAEGNAYGSGINGYHPARELTVDLGPVAVRVPRVSQVPPEVAPEGFHSQVVQRYQRASQSTQQLFACLYREDGQKELLAMESGYRESTESCLRC